MGIFLFMVLGVVVAEFFHYMERDRFGFWAAIAGIFFGGLVGGIFVVFGQAFEKPWEFEEDRCAWYTTETNIVSLSKGKNISGTFVLGTGSINSRMYYYTYLDTPNGYILDEYYTNNTYIVENGENKVISHHFRCDMPFTSFMLGEKKESKRTNQSHQLFVPKNTIIKEFKL